LDNSSKTLRRAQQKVGQLGLPLPEKPGGRSTEVSWPRNIADLSAEELARHMTWWEGWAAFAEYHLAEADTNAISFEKRLDLETQVRIHKSEGDYASVTALKASVAQQKDLQELQGKALQASAEKKLLRALLEGYRGKRDTISREITRRTREV
jgi:hypothetical protein